MKMKILPNVTTTKNPTKSKFKSALGIAGQLHIWASINRPPWRRSVVLVGLILACFALSPQARAVCQQGCDLANNNTFLGDNALINNTTGQFNTATGRNALLSNTTGISNTATGSAALLSNTIGTDNTATGRNALIGNTTGSFNTATGRNALFSNTTGTRNTATGSAALFSNTTGNDNTASGRVALGSNTTGSYNTASGVEALVSNTTGIENTAIGNIALQNNTTAGFNTATGSQALWSNTTGDFNTATGHTALASNTIGYQNTANGSQALISNTEGYGNVGIGFQSLNANTTGYQNTAIGQFALLSNTTGDYNTASGVAALVNNTTGGANVATGQGALATNNEGDWNTADGTNALVFNTTGRLNTAVGANALYNHTTGTLNVALGWAAGDLSTGDNNIVIGNTGAAADVNTIRIGAQAAVTDEFGVIHPAHRQTFIAGISGAAVNGRPVMINGNGRLGTAPSSARFKDGIKPMDRASEAILLLKPVTFCYKKEVDAERTPQFGFVAEDVEKVNPDLVTRDSDGKAFTVRYEAVNAMLLNEFLKEHRKVQEQGATIAKLKSIAAKQETINAQQQREIKALVATLREQASQIQKVSAQLELEKAPAQTVVNNQ